VCFAKTPSGDQVVDLLVLIRRAQALRVGQEVFQLLDLAGVNVLPANDVSGRIDKTAADDLEVVIRQNGSLDAAYL
jgi:hypothetical protein